MGSISGFFFATPSFLSGAASAFDLGATMFEFNSASSPEEADAIAARQDWRAVGADLRAAIEAHRTDGSDVEHSLESAR